MSDEVSEDTTTTTDADVAANFELLVLYGSQTGNAEGAAERLSSLAPSRLRLPNSSSKITSRHLQLDDFLLERRPKCGWTRLVVIITSSYGVGQAPLGCHRFRELCDRILLSGDDGEGSAGDDDEVKFLDGVRYAMLGLGDSSYTTYFENPRTIDRALTRAGAVRVGELWKADAIGGEPGVEETREQSVVMEEWTEAIWDRLNEVLAEEPTEELGDRLRRARLRTLDICRELFPDEFDDVVEEEDDDGKQKRKGGGGGWWSPSRLWSSAAVGILGVAMVALRRRGGGGDGDLGVA